MSAQYQNLVIENSSLDDKTLIGLQMSLGKNHGTVTFENTSVKESNILPSTACNITILGGSHERLRMGWYGS